MSRLAPEQYAVYLVTDDPSRYAGDFLASVDAAVAGGVTLVQYRDTESDDRTRYERCLALRHLLSARGVPLVVNNRVDLALAVGADAVHVGQDDLPPAAVRRLVGPALDIGWSVRNEAEARSTDAALVDAVGVGPVFDARATKADAADALGPAGLRTAIKALPRRPDGTRLATVAIGGIHAGNAAAVFACGVDGVSVVSAFSKAADPAAVARRFRELAGDGRRLP